MWNTQIYYAALYLHYLDNSNVSNSSYTRAKEKVNDAARYPETFWYSLYTLHYIPFTDFLLRDDLSKQLKDIGGPKQDWAQMGKLLGMLTPITTTLGHTPSYVAG